MTEKYAMISCSKGVQVSQSSFNYCMLLIRLIALQEMNTLQAQKDQAHSMLLRHHECTQDLEYKQIRGMQKLRWDQQQYQHQTEWANQMEYNKKAEMELQKKHLLELRQRPKTLKVIYEFSV